MPETTPLERLRSALERYDAAGMPHGNEHWMRDKLGAEMMAAARAVAASPSQPSGTDTREALIRVLDNLRVLQGDMQDHSFDDPAVDVDACTEWIGRLNAHREDLADALAASPSQDSGTIRWFRVTNRSGGAVPLEDHYRDYESAALELPRLDREFPDYAPFRVQTLVETKTHGGRRRWTVT